MTPASSLFIEPVREESPLPARLASALDPSALALARRISMQLLEALPPKSPVLWRRTRMISLLCLDALNAQRGARAREMRWERFVSALAPFARETGSPALLQLVAENDDLL